MRIEDMDCDEVMVQDEANHEDREQDKVHRIKNGADSTSKVIHIEKSGWLIVIRKIQMVKQVWVTTEEKRVLHVTELCELYR